MQKFGKSVNFRVTGEEMPQSNAGECAILSEESLMEDWDKSEEDRAWQNFQREILGLRFSSTIDDRQS